ncbi:hypothetical protein AGMMS50256_01150 [Betaproteobacteria bacterium]|nr:hypothetical protein AGMMS50256_01150 [Betaproteobacteria bacterium]
MAYKISEKRGYLGGKKYTAKERWIAFKNSFWAILMPIIVLGAIYSGICTPTESSAIAVAYSFILGKFIYRELTLSKIVDVFADAAISTANILCLISCAVAFAWVLGRLNVPVQVASYITELAESKVVFILLVNIMLFIVGMFMDPAPAILILSPILCPIAAFWGIDMIHFGIIMVMNLAVGCCTPPVGINLFLSCQIAETSFVSVAKDALPYLILLLIVVLVISYVPWLSLVLL